MIGILRISETFCTIIYDYEIGNWDGGGGCSQPPHRFESCVDVGDDIFHGIGASRDFSSSHTNGKVHGQHIPMGNDPCSNASHGQ